MRQGEKLVLPIGNWRNTYECVSEELGYYRLHNFVRWQITSRFYVSELLDGIKSEHYAWELLHWRRSGKFARRNASQRFKLAIILVRRFLQFWTRNRCNQCVKRAIKQVHNQYQRFKQWRYDIPTQRCDSKFPRAHTPKCPADALQRTKRAPLRTCTKEDWSYHYMTTQRTELARCQSLGDTKARSSIMLTQRNSQRWPPSGHSRRLKKNSCWWESGATCYTQHLLGPIPRYCNPSGKYIIPRHSPGVAISALLPWGPKWDESTTWPNVNKLGPDTVPQNSTLIQPRKLRVLCGT